jgi:hypothetical protein
MRERAEKASTFNFLPWLRLLFGLFLLFLLLLKTDLNRIFKIFSDLNLIWLLTAFFLAVVAVLLSAWRWQVVLKAQGVFLSLFYLFALYLEGLFFNNFLPSSIGGDAVRFAELGKDIEDYSASFSSILAERVLSSITLGFISFTAALFILPELKRLFFWVLIFFLVCGALFFLFLSAPQIFLRSSSQLVEKYKLKSVSGELLKVRNAKCIFEVIMLSLLFQLSLVFMNWAIFLSMGVDLNPLFYFIFIPITQAVSLIPLSFNGLGFREGSYVFLFGYVGISSTLSLTAALVFLFLVIILSLVGGVVFAFKK